MAASAEIALWHCDIFNHCIYSTSGCCNWVPKGFIKPTPISSGVPDAIDQYKKPFGTPTARDARGYRQASSIEKARAAGAARADRRRRRRDQESRLGKGHESRAEVSASQDRRDLERQRRHRRMA